jgi:rubrerythrin
MAFEQARDVIERARTIHKRMGEQYDLLGDVAERPRVKMLLDYLSRHERHLDEVLAKYEEAISKRILDCWFNYTPEMIPEDCVNCGDLSPDMSIDEIIKRAALVDECLLRLYEEMSNRAPHEDVRNVFQTLLEMEKREELELMRNALELKEI